MLCMYTAKTNAHDKASSVPWLDSTLDGNISIPLIAAYSYHDSRTRGEIWKKYVACSYAVSITCALRPA
jgi:hypothetical protein